MRTILLWLTALALIVALPAAAQNSNAPANQAERFVADNIRAGLAILNNAALDREAKSARFEQFLLGITDLDRIATFTLGNAAATPAQREAFTTAFRAYATATYRSYFQRYGGQSLAVTGSKANGPGDTIVHTRLSEAGSGNGQMVDFRVRTDGPRPLVLDIGIAGVWLALTQRDEFATFLARNGGDIGALTEHLNAVARSTG
jgi:phospholipid transport system substrate-binding protein